MLALGAGRIKEDNPDSLVNQEALLPGALFSMIVKESLSGYLAALKALIERDIRASESTRPGFTPPPLPVFDDGKWFRGCIEKACGKVDVGRKLDYFLGTGNLVSDSGLDLQQTSGFTVVAERLNYWRFISHFRSIHRGAFFAQLRTTTVRKLLPDSWGYLCPVHTPDGSPCGLLNHLAAACLIMQHNADRTEVASALNPVLAQAGAVLLPLGGNLPAKQYLPITLDSQLLARVTVENAPAVTAALRKFKVSRGVADGSPTDAAISTLEIALVLPGADGRFPGLFLLWARRDSNPQPPAFPPD